ncbi:MAG: tRNA preQ1(34) S-adenosylmethionine ribosyltransferase-isomerase QueA [Steroidobacterales bacterium]
MRRADFHFDLPRELIAQEPAPARTASRLLCFDAASGACRDLRFSDLGTLLLPGDLLVFNDTRVIPARVFAVKASGGRIELLLERALGATMALVHARSAAGLRPGAIVNLPGGHTARMAGRDGDLFRLEFSCDVLAYFEAHGDVPLPPYISRPAASVDRERYQTIYARSPGAVAAPTAGLHFDAPLLDALSKAGVRRAFVTLHVGAGTFQPVRASDIDAHVMHPERVSVPEDTCAAIAATRAAAGRVIAVGTTVVRSLEAAAAGGTLQAFSGETRIFIRPGYRFRVVDALLTNFHLPESTLLMLCAAFAGREALLAAYAHAVRARYRFFSYGDAMFLTPRADSLVPR